MPVFASLSRRRATPPAGVAGRELTDDVRLALPLRFEAVAEALLAGEDTTAACTVVGRDVARDGASLGEALSGLRTTYDLVLGGRPDFDAAEALSVAWSEATLEYLHDLSCEDPMTGLASMAHVRTRVAEIYRDAELSGVSTRESHALVLVDVRYPIPVGGPEHHFTRALRLVQLTEAIRSVFSGGHTVGRLGQDRVVVVVPRTTELGSSVALLRDLLDTVDVGTAEVRVWIEGLPGMAESGARLLDELAR